MSALYPAGDNGAGEELIATGPEGAPRPTLTRDDAADEEELIATGPEGAPHPTLA